MRILVTGSNGQLGNELKQLSNQGHEFLFTDFLELDITQQVMIDGVCKEFAPHQIINCAAYTNVDRAEQEPGVAFSLNGDGPALLALGAKKCGARLLHVSTDYVFSGKNYKPYVEEDVPDPAGVYARSKAAGEIKVLENNPESLIVRTSWLYSAYGHNFVKTIRKAGRNHGELKVVADQIGTPTWGHDLAKALLLLAELGNQSGIVHFSNQGVCSWYDFALAIVEFSGIDTRVCPTDTEGYPLPSPRPYYSVLNKNKYELLTRTSIPHWRQSLKKCIKILDEQG